MPTPLNLTGQRFGRLTALRPDLTTGKRRWAFVCDCGNQKTANAALVRYGSIRSCGCLRSELTSARQSGNLIGKRFGRLLVMNALADRDRHGRIVWNCTCDCGRSTLATTVVLNKGGKQSCGCLRREQMRALGLASKKENPVSKTAEYRKAIKAKRRADPTIAMAERVSGLLAYALRSIGAIKRSDTFDLLGYSPTDLKKHIEKQFTRGMSWRNRDTWEIDHITPISTATCEADVIALNQLSNLRPLWSTLNNQKRCQRVFLI